jgi:uncharacterized protein with HEPN domain
MREIIGFRNILVHGYDMINQATVYTIVIKHVPALHRKVSNLLEEEG